ncbi:MAG: hypothetical protein R3D27_01680 [Hyphomicrobiaceae bacterium]
MPKQSTTLPAALAPSPVAARPQPPGQGGIGFAPGTIRPSKPPAGRVEGYAIQKISLFDEKGRWLRQVPATTLPAVPAGGVPFHYGPKGLLLVTLGGRQILLDQSELDVKTDPRVSADCAKLRRDGLSIRSGSAAMGHGQCWSS